MGLEVSVPDRQAFGEATLALQNPHEVFDLMLFDESGEFSIYLRYLLESRS